MAQTIDKYVLETSVTGMKDVDALNTSVTTLGKSIDSVTSKKIAMTVNATGFSDLNNTISGINTSLNNIANKTVKPTVALGGIDQLNASIRGLSGLLSQVNSNLVNIQVNDSEVLRAKQDVSLLNSEIDKANGNSVSIKADAAPTSLMDSIDAIKNAAAPYVAAAVALGAYVTATVSAAGALKDMSDASGLTTSQLLTLKDTMIDAGGSADSAEKFVNKLMLSINDAAAGNEKAIDTFKALNVPIKEANGEMRSTAEISADVITALGGITDQATRQKLATDLLGKSLMGLNYKDMAFADVPMLNEQIDKVDSVGAAWDRVSSSLTKLNFSTVSSSGSVLVRFLDDLNLRIKQFNELSNDSPTWLNLLGSGFKNLFQAINPVGALMRSISTETSWLGDKIQKLYTIMSNTPKDGAALIQGYRGKGFVDPRIAAAQNLPPIPSNEKPPGKFAPAQFGTPKGGGDGGAKAAADAAAREAEARKKAREASDAQLKSMQLLQQEEQTMAMLKTKMIGQNKIESEAAISRAEILKTLNLDYAKVEAEITKEKQKGKDADQYIIDNLNKQKGLIAQNAEFQKKYNDARVAMLALEKENKDNFAEDLAKSKKTADEIAKLKDSSSKVPGIQAEIDKLAELKDSYLLILDAQQKLGEENGYASEAFVKQTEAFSIRNQMYLDMLNAQKAKVIELQNAEKARSESFAGGWESAMQRMTKSMEPAQLGAQAFDDLWGNISSSIDTAVTTGKFKFADFRDAIISDISKMMAKALASKLIGALLGTAVSAVIPGAGAGVAIGGDKGGSALFPRAKGGSVGGGQPYLVGERGPELFMPGQNGTVIPNRNLTADSKPQVVNNYTYNVSAVDANGVSKFFMDNKTMVAAANSAARRERG